MANQPNLRYEVIAVVRDMIKELKSRPIDAHYSPNITMVPQEREKTALQLKIEKDIENLPEKYR